MNHHGAGGGSDRPSPRGRRQGQPARAERCNGSHGNSFELNDPTNRVSDPTSSLRQTRSVSEVFGLLDNFRMDFVTGLL